MKWCDKCQRDTDRRKDGFCKPCDAARAREYRRTHPGCSKERDAARYAAMTPEQKKAHVAKLREHAEKNPERRAAYLKKYAEDNADKIRDRSREWAKNNPDRQRERTARYHAENPNTAMERSRVRRGAMKNRTPKWANQEEIRLIYLKAAEFMDAGIDCEVDHIYPLQGEFVSGLHCPANLEIISTHANRSKQVQSG